MSYDHIEIFRNKLGDNLPGDAALVSALIDAEFYRRDNPHPNPGNQIEPDAYCIYVPSR